MWLDAFKRKSVNIQNIGVTGVTGVTAPANPMIVWDAEYGAGVTPANVHGVTGVTPIEKIQICDTRDTSGHRNKNRCHSKGIDSKPNASNGYGDVVTPVTPVTPQKHHKPQSASNTADMLALFGLDLVQQEIDAGYPADELHRVNNMAWEFMQADGMEFDEAIRIAAEIVVSTQAAACEASYADVMALFSKLRLKGRV